MTVGSIGLLAQVFERQVEVLVSAGDVFSEYSTVATALKIERDGIDSWKIHIFDLVDEFRRTVDGRLIILPPPHNFDRRISALLASTVRTLCEELGVSAPRWATLRYFIPTPWFPADSNSLKASAILESPLYFRANNIFVLSNFLSRM